jgi:hypothetical protein
MGFFQQLVRNPVGTLVKAEKQVLSDPAQAVSNVVSPVVATAKQAIAPVMDAAGNLVDQAGKIVKTAAQNLTEFVKTPAGQIALSIALPGMGTAIAEQMALSEVMSATAAKAVGTALASVSVQTAQGVPFETALQNSAISATIQTGSPDIAKYIIKVGGEPGFADALTSAGTSAGGTLLKGGTAEDAFRNAIAGAGASVISGETGSRVAGQVGGTLLAGGSATQAAISGATELGKEDTSGFKAKQEAVSSATPDVSVTNIARSDAPVSALPPVEVTAKRDTQDNIQNISTLPEVTVTDKRLPKDNIQTVDVVGLRDTTTPTERSQTSAAPDTKPYNPNLFYYSSFTPSTSTLPASLGTNLQAPYPGSTTTTGLTSARGAGEIEGQETGGKRQDVWNEASLRLKDALGV